MDKKRVVKYLKIAIVCIVVALFLWFLVIHPLLTFKGYENQIESAAKRYFELNESQLPTGTRVKTLSVQELFDQAYLKEDFYVPFSKKPCSITESWVKVRKEDGKYKYYTYLQCGVLSSLVDHEGPEIILNGDDEITIDQGDKYEELGVKSVVDNSDGKMNVDDVEIDSSDVNTNVTGTYKVTYTTRDSLNNRTEKVREVSVVSRIKNIVKNNTGDLGVYTGSNPNNYMYFSGMVFRIIGLDGDNVRIVAEEDISNVNYSAIDDWLEYYYDHLTDKAKDYIVENKYCNMKLDDNSVGSVTDCSSYTGNRSVAILSANDINQAQGDDGNYLYPLSISWVLNTKNKDEAYTTRNFFYNSSSNYMSFDKDYNFGVRPVLTIQGDVFVVDGDGTKEDPYSIGDFTYAKTGDKVNSRYSGEFLTYSGILWRIIDVEKGGVTKIISTSTLNSDGQKIQTHYTTEGERKIYNPKQRGNIGYFINNQARQYIDTDYLVTHEVEVPIYKNEIKYGKEVDTKTYDVLLAAPNMYEMFSAFEFNSSTLHSYWLINSSRQSNTKAVIADLGTSLYGNIYDNTDYGVRPVAFLDENCTIVRGNGTFNNPYSIAK